MLSKLSGGPAQLCWTCGLTERERGQASHLTERISGPVIKSESLQDGERKLEKAKFINYKSPSYPDPNLSHCDKLHTNPDIFASGFSNYHLIFFSIPSPFLFSSS